MGQSYNIVHGCLIFLLALVQGSMLEIPDHNRKQELQEELPPGTNNGASLAMLRRESAERRSHAVVNDLEDLRDDMMQTVAAPTEWGSHVPTGHDPTLERISSGSKQGERLAKIISASNHEHHHQHHHHHHQNGHSNHEHHHQHHHHHHQNGHQGEWLPWTGAFLRDPSWSEIQMRCKEDQYIDRWTFGCSNDGVHRLYEAECSDGAKLTFNRGGWVGHPTTIMWAAGRKAVEMLETPTTLKRFDFCGDRGDKGKMISCNHHGQMIAGVGIRYKESNIYSMTLYCQKSLSYFAELDGVNRSVTIAELKAAKIAEKAMKAAHHLQVTNAEIRGANWDLTDAENSDAKTVAALHAAEQGIYHIDQIAKQASQQVEQTIHTATVSSEKAKSASHQATVGGAEVLHLDDSITKARNSLLSFASNFNSEIAKGKKLSLEDQKLLLAAIKAGTISKAWSQETKEKTLMALKYMSALKSQMGAIQSMVAESQATAHFATSGLEHSINNVNLARSISQSASDKISKEALEVSRMMDEAEKSLKSAHNIEQTEQENDDAAYHAESSVESASTEARTAWQSSEHITPHMRTLAENLGLETASAAGGAQIANRANAEIWRILAGSKHDIGMINQYAAQALLKEHASHDVHTKMGEYDSAASKYREEILRSMAATNEAVANEESDDAAADRMLKKSMAEKSNVKTAVLQAVASQKSAELSIAKAGVAEQSVKQSHAMARTVVDQARRAEEEAQAEQAQVQAFQQRAETGLAVAKRSMQDTKSQAYEALLSKQEAHEALNKANEEAAEAKNAGAEAHQSISQALSHLADEKKLLSAADYAKEEGAKASQAAEVAVKATEEKLSQANDAKRAAQTALHYATHVAASAEVAREEAQTSMADAENVLGETKAAAAESKSAIDEAAKATAAGNLTLAEAKQSVEEAAASVESGKAEVNQAKAAVDGAKAATAESEVLRGETEQAAGEAEAAVNEAKSSFGEAEGAMNASKLAVQASKDAIDDIKSINSEVSTLAATDMSNENVENKIVHLLQFLTKQDLVNEKTQVGLNATLTGAEKAVDTLHKTQATQDYILNTLAKKASVDEGIMDVLGKHDEAVQGMMNASKRNFNITQHVIEATEHNQNAITKSMETMEFGEKAQDAILVAQEKLGATLNSTAVTIEKAQGTNIAAFEAANGTANMIKAGMKAVDSNQITIEKVIDTMTSSVNSTKASLNAVNKNAATIQAALNYMHSAQDQDANTMDSIYKTGVSDEKQTESSEGLVRTSEKALKALGEQQITSDKLLQTMEKTSNAQKMMLDTLGQQNNVMEKTGEAVKKQILAKQAIVSHLGNVQNLQRNILNAMTANGNTMTKALKSVEGTQMHDEVGERLLNSEAKLEKSKELGSGHAIMKLADTFHAIEAADAKAEQELKHGRSVEGSLYGREGGLHRASDHVRDLLAQDMNDMRKMGQRITRSKEVQDRHNIALQTITRDVFDTTQYAQMVGEKAKSTEHVVNRVGNKVHAAYMAESGISQGMHYWNGQMDGLGHYLQYEDHRLHGVMSWQDHQAAALRHAVGAERQFGRVAHTLEGSSYDYSNHLGMLNDEIGHYAQDHGYYGQGYDSMSAAINNDKNDFRRMRSMQRRNRARFKSDDSMLDHDIGDEMHHDAEEEALAKSLRNERKALERELAAEDRKLNSMGKSSRGLNSELSRDMQEFGDVSSEDAEDSRDILSEEQKMRADGYAAKELGEALDNFEAVDKDSAKSLGNLEGREAETERELTDVSGRENKINKYKDDFDTRLNVIETKKNGVYGRQQELDTKMENSIKHLNEVADAAVAEADDKEKAQGKAFKAKYKNLQNKEVAQHKQVTGYNKQLSNTRKRLTMINQNSTNHTKYTEYLKEEQKKLDEHDRLLQENGAKMATTLYLCLGMGGLTVLGFIFLNASFNTESAKIIATFKG